MTEPTLDPRDLRRAFGAFATGVTVVTTSGEGDVHWGFTANSFTSVSLDPPLLLVCLGKSSGSREAFEAADHFAVNILSAEQRGVSAAFAGRGVEKFSGIPWFTRETGSPLIEGSVAWLDCRMHERVDAGDHIILVGRVVAYEYNMEAPLGFCRGAYISFDLAEQAQRATEDSASIRVGAVIEREGALLFHCDPKTGRLSIPTARKLGEKSAPDSLIGRLAEAGVHARLPFLYAVYDDHGTHCIVYRGELLKENAGKGQGHGQGQSDLQFIAFHDIPWDRLVDSAITTMIRRYIREHEEEAFGLYVGDFDQGNIQSLK